jgi:hypothetical protein
VAAAVAAHLEADGGAVLFLLVDRRARHRAALDQQHRLAEDAGRQVAGAHRFGGRIEIEAEAGHIGDHVVEHAQRRRIRQAVGIAAVDQRGGGIDAGGGQQASSRPAWSLQSP